MVPMSSISIPVDCMLTYKGFGRRKGYYSALVEKLGRKGKEREKEIYEWTLAKKKRGKKGKKKSKRKGEGGEEKGDEEAFNEVEEGDGGSRRAPTNYRLWSCLLGPPKRESSSSN